jgi:hypothetical protein
MSTGAWIAVAVAAIAVVAIVGWIVARRKRSEQLQGRFGPEYNRTVAEAGSKRTAEQELEARQQRRAELDIRQLDPAARERYLHSWQETQSRFVDAPADAICEADGLVQSVMRDRGYPVDDFEQRAADISVDHPEVVQSYRAAHGVSLANEHGQATTEDLRRAMVDYRSLFDELLEAEENGARRWHDETPA